MTEFVPPYPPRSKTRLAPLRLIRRARRNLLEVFDERAFQVRFATVPLLRRKVFICNTPELVQQVFGAQNSSFERKSQQMRHALEPLLGDGLFISDGATWKSRRKLVGPVIHVSKLGEFAPVMVETVNEAKARWQALPPDRPVDILAEMAELTAEIICRTIFGRQLGGHHAREVVEGFSDYQRLVGQMDVLSLIGLPDWLPRLHGPRIRKATRRIHAVLDGIIADYRRGASAGEVSVIGHLLEARDEDTGRPLDDRALRNEAAVIFMAGHETTANTLAWAWFLLSQSPAVQERLEQELDATLGARDPVLADVPNLPYTRAVVEETLRLYPPVPVLAREALREESILGRTVPKGSIIMVVPWTLHRHRDLWNKPDHFMPERFLEGSGEPVSRFAYVPFSTGPRVCAGLSFGLTEAILCLAVLARSFRLRLKPGHVVEPVCRLSLRPGDRLPMFIVPRAQAVGGEAPAQALAAACPHVH